MNCITYHLCPHPLFGLFNKCQRMSVFPHSLIDLGFVCSYISDAIFPDCCLWKDKKLWIVGRFVLYCHFITFITRMIGWINFGGTTKYICFFFNHTVTVCVCMCVHVHILSSIITELFTRFRRECTLCLLKEYGIKLRLSPSVCAWLNQPLKQVLICHVSMRWNDGNKIIKISVFCKSLFFKGSSLSWLEIIFQLWLSVEAQVLDSLQKIIAMINFRF